MRIVQIAVIVFLIAFCGYAYTHDQPGCEKILKDFVELGKALAKPQSTLEKPAPSESPATPSSSDAAPASAAPAPGVAAEPPAPAPSAPKTDALSMWVAPMTIPSQTHWAMTTTEGRTYNNVRITQVDADCITILCDDGGALVPISKLSADLQRQLNYDPDAAAEAAAKRKQTEDVQTSYIAAKTASAEIDAPWGDYSGALQKARQSNKKVLLFFTGSDWCPYCKLLDKDIKTPAFEAFSGQHFVFVTVDFPRSMELPADEKAQNDSLQKQFNISGYPTLVVVTPEGKEVGRTGYVEGAGSTGLIADLGNYCK